MVPLLVALLLFSAFKVWRHAQSEPSDVRAET